MKSVLTRFRAASALTLLGAAAAAGCDRGSTPQSNTQVAAADSRVAEAAPAGQYNPAITVYKNPT